MIDKSQISISRALSYGWPDLEWSMIREDYRTLKIHRGGNKPSLEDIESKKEELANAINQKQTDRQNKRQALESKYADLIDYLVEKGILPEEE